MSRRCPARADDFSQAMSLPLSIHWDFYDQVAGLDAPYGPREMSALCRAAKAAGARSLNFRAEGAGMAWVPSSDRPLFARYEPGLALPWCAQGRMPRDKEVQEARQRVAELFRRTYELCPDPLEAAANAAREAGIQLNVYVCPYDQYWPGVPETLVEAYPERCIASRDGRMRLPVPSLAYEETRRWLLKYYDAVLAHDVADVIVYPGSHGWYQYPVDVPDDWFGFEEPAVEEYRARTGIDVRSGDFDIDDYYRHYGTYWTRLLRELSERQKRRGRRVIVGMDLGEWQVYLPWNAPRLMTTWRHGNDWREWTSWSNVDLCVGQQTNIWEYDRWPANQLPYMPGSPGRPPYLWARDLFGARGRRAFELHAFLSLHADRADVELPLAARGTREGGFDGLMVREAADFEFKLGWGRLADLRP